MIQGIYEVFIGLLALVLSLVWSNDPDPRTGFLRHLRKQGLFICGASTLILGLKRIL